MATFGGPARGTSGVEPAELTGSAVFLGGISEPTVATAGPNAADDGLRIISVAESGTTTFHPRLSPNGRLVAFDSDRDGERGVYLAERNGTNVRRVSGVGFATMPSWSPDGQQLAFLRAEPSRPTVWNVWVRTLGTDGSTRMTSYRTGQPSAAAWLPDGHRLCYGYEHALIILDTRGLELGSGGSVVKYPSPVEGHTVGLPVAAPDGRRIAFQVNGDGVWIIDVQTQEMKRIVQDASVDDLVWDSRGRRLAYHSRRNQDWRLWISAPWSDRFFNRPRPHFDTSTRRMLSR
jgi:Tol biopolymer transport system component